MSTLAVLSATLVAPGAAMAASPANPYATATLSKTYDGSGFGTGSAPWLNAANGFAPGDNGPADNVVSSGDVVGYDLTLQVAAGPARTVQALLQLPPYLSFAPERNVNVCAVNQFVSGQLVTVGGLPGCEYQVRAGVPVTITTPLVLTAKDTAGTAQYGQAPRVAVRIAGDADHAAFTAASVTVVSAPAADVVVKPSQCSQSGVCTTQSTANRAGHFDLQVEALKYAGYDSTKGASSAASWWGTFDVSSFPAGTTWTLGGTPVTPAGGVISIPASSGDVRVAYTAPEGWGLDDAEDGFFPVHLTVHPDSFSSADYRNNGTGWQPGDGEGPGESTLNARGTGARSGYIYPNNDWSAARVATPPAPAPGAMFGKSIVRPWDTRQGLFQDGNMLFSSGSRLAVSEYAFSRSNHVAPGTELDAELIAYTQNIEANPDQVVMSDQWDPAEQVPRAPVRVIAPDGTDVTARAVVQWYMGATAPGPAAVDTSITAGWVTQSAPPANARAVRVVLANLPTGEAAGAGRFAAVVPLQVLAALPEPMPGALWDTMHGTVDGSDVIAAPRFVTPVLETPPTLGITMTSDPVSEINRATNRVDYSVAAEIRNVARNDVSLIGSITLELDACVTGFQLTSSEWEIVDGPDFGTGCGSDSPSTGSVTLQPAGGSWLPSNLLRGVTELPKLSYTTTLSRLALDQVFASASWSLDRDDVTAVTAGRQLSAPLVVTAGNFLATSTPEVEIGDPMHFEAVVQLSEPGTSPTSETVIVLPDRGDDAAYLAQLTASGFYDGPEESAFNGTYEVTGVSVDAANSVPGTRVWCTTDASPSLDPSVNAWVADCADGLTGVTAIKVTQTGGGELGISTVNIELTPAGNRPDDNYLMWIGPTHYGDGDDATEVAWPANDVVVASYVSGIVYWDEAGRGSDYRTSWEGIPGVTVQLLDAADAVVATTTTGPTGHYRFGDLDPEEHPLHSGDYRVSISGYPTSVPSAHYTGKTLLVDQTFSYQGQRLGNAAPVSTVVDLPAATSVRNVNFGFYAADPYSDVSKSVSQVECSTDPDSNVCEIEWDVTVKNAGNTPLTGGALTDLTNSAVYDIEALAGARIAEVYTVRETSTTRIFVLTTAGDLYGWGYDGFNAVGAPQDIPVRVTQPKKVLSNVVDLILSDYRNYAITANGDLYGWGQDSGYLGLGTIPGLPGLSRKVPQVILPNIDSVQMMGSTTFALSTDGTLYSWGANVWGIAGQGTDSTAVIDTPAAVLTDVATVTVTPFNSSVYAVTRAGDLYTWGSNSRGQLGNGTTVNQNAPVKVMSDVDYVLPHSGRLQLAGAVTHGGELWTWGRNDFGQVGNGTQVDQLTPVKVLDDVVAASTGRHAGMRTQSSATGRTPWAITASGDLYSWGFNQYGKVGDGTTVHRLTPALVMSDVAEVLEPNLNGGGLLTGALDTMYVLTVDGSLYAWGRNSVGLVGDGTQTVRTTPFEVVFPDGGSLVQLAGDGTQTVFAVTSLGNLYGWGQNLAPGRPLGLPHVTYVTSPRLIMPDIASFAEAETDGQRPALFAVDTWGVLWAWGYSNTSGLTGYVGNDSLDPQLTPMQILSGVDSVIFAGASTFARTTTNDLYGWGRYHVGNGTQDLVLSPEEVLAPWEDEATVLPPLSQGITGDTLQSVYSVPDLAPGDIFTVSLRGKVNQGEDGFVVGNQAWYTSNEDPRTAPASGPALPAFDEADPLAAGKWLGNAECTAGPDAEATWTADADGDSCDQVFASVPATPLALGSLSGLVWWDADEDGARGSSEQLMPGFTATLFLHEPGEEPVRIASTLTGANGEYEFPNLLPSDYYTVQFSPPATTPLEWWSYTQQATACPAVDASCVYPEDSADRLTGQTPLIAVTEGSLTEHVNAGVILNEIVPADFLIEKQGPDAAGDWQPLDGSEWALHHAVDDGAGGYLTGALAQVPDAVTGQTGLFSLTGILPGTYHLVETVAPTGFELLAQPVLVTVTNVEDPVTGDLTVLVEAAAPAELSTGTLGVDTLDKIVVKDTPKLWVPNVGADSWAWVIWMALGLLVLGGAGLVIIRRTGRRDEEVVA